MTRTRSNTSNTSLEMCKDYISRPLPHYVTSGINTKAQQICIDTTLYTPVHTMYVPCSYIYGTGGLRFSGSPTWNTENYFWVTIELVFPRLPGFFSKPKISNSMIFGCYHPDNWEPSVHTLHSSRGAQGQFEKWVDSNIV